MNSHHAKKFIIDCWSIIYNWKYISSAIISCFTVQSLNLRFEISVVLSLRVTRYPLPPPHMLLTQWELGRETQLPLCSLFTSTVGYVAINDFCFHGNTSAEPIFCGLIAFSAASVVARVASKSYYFAHAWYQVRRCYDIYMNRKMLLIVLRDIYHKRGVLYRNFRITWVNRLQLSWGRGVKWTLNMGDIYMVYGSVRYLVELEAWRSEDSKF